MIVQFQKYHLIGNFFVRVPDFFQIFSRPPWIFFRGCFFSAEKEQNLVIVLFFSFKVMVIYNLGKMLCCVSKINKQPQMLHDQWIEPFSRINWRTIEFRTNVLYKTNTYFLFIKVSTSFEKFVQLVLVHEQISQLENSSNLNFATSELRLTKSACATLTKAIPTPNSLNVFETCKNGMEVFVRCENLLRNTSNGWIVVENESISSSAVAYLFY